MLQKFTKNIPDLWTLVVAFFLAATVTVIVSYVNFIDYCSAWQHVPIIQAFFVIICLVVIVLTFLGAFLWKIITHKQLINQTKFTLWMLLLIIIFIIQNVLRSSSDRFVTSQIHQKLDVVRDQLVSYHKAHKEFPQNLQEAGIDDYVLVNIPGFKIRYTQLEMPEWSNEETVIIRILGFYRHIYSSTYAQDVIEPGCGW